MILMTRAIVSIQRLISQQGKSWAIHDPACFNYRYSPVIILVVKVNFLWVDRDLEHFCCLDQYKKSYISFSSSTIAPGKYLLQDHSWRQERPSPLRFHASRPSDSLVTLPVANTRTIKEDDSFEAYNEGYKL